MAEIMHWYKGMHQPDGANRKPVPSVGQQGEGGREMMSQGGGRGNSCPWEGAGMAAEGSTITYPPSQVEFPNTSLFGFTQLFCWHKLK